MPEQTPEKDIAKEIIELLKGLSYRDACQQLDAVKGLLEFESIVREPS